MLAWSQDRNSVRLSVRLSHACFVTKRKNSAAKALQEPTILLQHLFYLPKTKSRFLRHSLAIDTRFTSHRWKAHSGFVLVTSELLSTVLTAESQTEICRRWCFLKTVRHLELTFKKGKCPSSRCWCHI